MNELYKPVVGYEGLYEVSDQGGGRSLDRIVPCKSNDGRGRRKSPGKRLKPWPDKDGYQIITLSKENVTTRRPIHILVMQAFVGPCPKGMQVCHNNGDPGDNRLSNLRYDTRSNNNKDKRLHGTALTGEKHHMARLTNHDVRCIKQCLKSPYRGIVNDLARRFGVNRESISKIRNGRTWVHVQ